MGIHRLYLAPNPQAELRGYSCVTDRILRCVP